MRYAGFWRRTFAMAIDCAIITLAAGLLEHVVWHGSWIAGNLWGVLFLLYYAAFESSRQRATIGKQVVGIIVCGSDGRQLAFPRAAIRTLAKILSAMILFVGFLMPLVTVRKQALHDILTDAVVVRK